jgi:hypothetical protein
MLFLNSGSHGAAGAGFEPALAFLQACVEIIASEFAKSGDTQLRTQKFKELREVIEAWPKLSPELRAARRALHFGRLEPSCVATRRDSGA